MTVKELKEILDKMNDDYEVVYSDTLTGISETDLIDVDDVNKWVLLDTI